LNLTIEATGVRIEIYCARVSVVTHPTLGLGLGMQPHVAAGCRAT